jgi:hypothetical protein
VVLSQKLKEVVAWANISTFDTPVAFNCLYRIIGIGAVSLSILLTYR